MVRRSRQTLRWPAHYTRITNEPAMLEANAVLRRIARREDSHNLDQHVAQLMKAAGVAEPTPEQRQHFDRKRKKSLSNQDSVNPHVRKRGSPR